MGGVYIFYLLLPLTLQTITYTLNNIIQFTKLIRIDHYFVELSDICVVMGTTVSESSSYYQDKL